MKVAGNEVRAGDKYNVTSDETSEGNVFYLLKDSWEKLRPFLAWKTEFGKDARFEQRFLYPEGACREGLTNAVAHRAYNITNSVDVFIFDDRLEIKSPGPLLSTLTIQGLNRLQGAHESRNALVVRVLRESKFMRELGEGMRRIFELMRESDLQHPILYSNDSWFSITLPHKALFNEQQKNWLKLFDALNPSGQQRKVLALGMEGRDVSKRDIERALNTVDEGIYRQITTPLSNAGVLKRIRNQTQIKSYSAAQRIDPDDVPRFKVVQPKDATPAKLAARAQAHPQNLECASEIAGSPGGFPEPLASKPKTRVYIQFRPGPEPLTIQQVIAFFKGCGIVKHAELPNFPGSLAQRGFGFVWFDSAEQATRAVEEMNRKMIAGRIITVRKFRDRDDA